MSPKTVGVIFHPFRRKSSAIIRYFPSVRMEIYTHTYAILLLQLISVHRDGNQL